MRLTPENVGTRAKPVERSWTADDVLQYALAVGAGQDDPATELEFTTENSADTELRVLPSFVNLLGFGSGRDLAGDIDLHAVLHAEQSFEVHRPLPVEGTARIEPTLAAMYDKGNATLVVLDSTTTDARTGELL